MDKKKILIVDDDSDVRVGFNIRLRANGYDTTFAGDAIAAVGEARRYGPDLILLDIGLPGGDGFLVMERLQKIPQLAVIPIIVVTARDPARTRDRALQAGAVAFFQKPVANDELLAAIKNALGDSG